MLDYIQMIGEMIGHRGRPLARGLTAMGKETRRAAEATGRLGVPWPFAASWHLGGKGLQVY
jgi:hypothetical protein